MNIIDLSYMYKMTSPIKNSLKSNNRQSTLHVCDFMAIDNNERII